MVDNFQKYMKIKNFVSSKTENYQKIRKTPVSDHPPISHKYWVEKWRNSVGKCFLYTLHSYIIGVKMQFWENGKKLPNSCKS